MQFCPTCDNKLNMRTAQHEDTGVCKVFLYCKNCTYSRALDHQVADGMCMYRSNYSKDHPLYFRSLVNKFTPYDRTLPRSIDIPCPNGTCASHQLQDGDAPNEVVYIRYDDENVRYLYMCCCCKTCCNVQNIVIVGSGCDRTTLDRIITTVDVYKLMRAEQVAYISS